MPHTQGRHAISHDRPSKQPTPKSSPPRHKAAMTQDSCLRGNTSAASGRETLATCSGAPNAARDATGTKHNTQQQGSAREAALLASRARTSKSEPPPRPSMALTVDDTNSTRAASAASVATAVPGFRSRPPIGFTAV